LGFIWVILNPLILLSAQAYVFVAIFKVQMENYSLYLVSGLLPWMFFSQTLEMTSSAYVNQGSLLRAFNLKPMTITLSQVIDNALNSLIAIFLVFSIHFIIFHKSLEFELSILSRFTLGFIPWILTVITVSFIVGVLHVSYRDTKFVASFFLQVGFYLTPILYPSNYVPTQMAWLLKLNPIYVLIRPMQVRSENLPTLIWLEEYLLAWGLFIVIALISWVIWKKEQNNFYAKI